MIGKHEEALGIMKKAINFKRGESQYYQNMKLSHLAEYYRRAGRYAEAIDASRMLLNSNPNNNHTLRAYITLACATVRWETMKMPVQLPRIFCG